jgi:riboflavin kinase
LKRIKLSGTVFSGQGESKKFLELPWVRRQVEEKLGFTPYLGTLNIRLTEESVKRKQLLENAQPIQVCPPQDYCNGAIFKASIGSLECAIVIPEVANYPKDVLELIAAENLKEKLHLVDGDRITVTVNL